MDEDRVRDLNAEHVERLDPAQVHAAPRFSCQSHPSFPSWHALSLTYLRCT